MEFMQWWEPELPAGAFAGLVEECEAQVGGIEVELLSGPYSSIKEQVIAGSAAGTMPDVLGLDGAWVNDFSKQGSIADLSAAMSSAGYDESQLAAQVQVGGITYMVPVVNFAYPMFVNNELLAQAGVSEPPGTREEFLAAANAVAQNTDAAGWVTALGLEKPNGIGADILPWVWASGGSMLTEDQRPAVDSPEVASAVEFIKQMWDDGAIAPGALTMAEQDKVEEFTNGRVGMMISSLAHINLIRENNPDLDFTVVPVPVEEGFSGTPGVRYASWGIGMSANTEHPEESWKLIECMLSQDVNKQLSAYANGFPGNAQVTPDFTDSDPLFEKAFEVWQAGTPVFEFTGLPQAEQLMRIFDEQLQQVLAENKPVPDALTQIQTEWETIF